MNLVVKKIATERVTSGGILIPESEAEKRDIAAIKADVLAVGPLAFIEERQFERDFGISVELVRPGDRVMTSRYAGYSIEHDGQEYQVIKDADVTAVLEVDDE